ncbi:hypothetical protein Tsubulata_021236 [Turnera subulata]|uniref:NusB/RsmB/TIM44 domain-containing protein n=1 Tax=Turnera subulata TaxID=218843 RepID=A0A9Q0J186_9ROSI|nr:hypothetical protein Tsubulata_021236 [Turnera subulata]
MEAASLLSCSYSSAASSSRTHYKSNPHHTCNHSHPQIQCQNLGLGWIRRKNNHLQVALSSSSSSSYQPLRSSLLPTSAFVVDKPLEGGAHSTTSGKEMMPKLDKSGRFCSPRAARELALMILYAACLEGSDPIRLFEKRMNARREPGYEFDKASLLKYDHMTYGGPPVTTQTVEEADELLLIDEKVSAIEAEVLSAPPKLVYSKLILRFTRKLLVAVVDKWDTHALVIQKIAPRNWKSSLEAISFSNFMIVLPCNVSCGKFNDITGTNETCYLLPFGKTSHKLTIFVLQQMPAGRILELCILHLAMSEIKAIGTQHQIVINEAVDLAKRFCDGAAPRTVNGCLRTFMNEVSGCLELPQGDEVMDGYWKLMLDYCVA